MKNKVKIKITGPPGSMKGILMYDIKAFLKELYYISEVEESIREYELEMTTENSNETIPRQ